MTPNAMDIQMKLMAGMPVMAGGIPIKPQTLRYVTDIGFSVFQGSVNTLMITMDDILESISDPETRMVIKASRDMYKVFDMIVMSDGMREVVIESLKIVLNTQSVKDSFNNEIGMHDIIVEDKYVINRDNYDEIVRIIELQNNPSGSSHSDEDDYKPADDLASSVAEKLKKSKEIVEKSKAMNSEGEGLTLIDIISAVSAMSNSINKINIWDLTIYQLYDEFARLMKIDNYQLQIQASMWSSEVEIDHWSDPL